MIIETLTFNPLLYLFIPVSFLLGSVPFGVLLTRNMGIDLKRMGSGNIGATNVLRSAGKMPAILTLLGDLVKGLAPVLICRYAISHMDYASYALGLPAAMEDFWPAVAGISAVLGHMYSVFLSFKGGKGVATGLGVLLAYSPPVAGIMLLIWISVALIFKISSLAAICAVVAMPFIFLLYDASGVRLSFATLLAVMIVYKHKSNIHNLLSGKESRIGKG